MYRQIDREMTQTTINAIIIEQENMKQKMEKLIEKKPQLLELSQQLAQQNSVLIKMQNVCRCKIVQF